MTNQLPNGWINAPIGNLCELINGRAFKPTEWKDLGLPIIRIQNLNNSNATFNYFDGEVLDKHRVKNGDLLFAWSGTPGTSFGAHVWKGSNAVLNQHIFKIDFLEILISKNFFRYAINQKLDELVGNAQGGVGLRHVTKGTFEKTELAFPPLAEQKEIAACLDMLLAQVDTLKTRLDAIPNILKRFRQSVLATAVSGKLTEEWRGEHKNLSSQLVSIGDICESSFYGPRFSKNDYAKEGVPTIRTTDMTERGKIIITSETPRILVPTEKIEQFRVNKGDLLITRTGSIGVMAIFDGDYIAIPSAYLIRFRFLSTVCVKYLYYFLTSPIGLKELGLGVTAITQPNINAQTIKSIKFNLPVIEEQTEIVRRVEELFAFADQIEQQVKAAQQRVNHLTQAILAKAFRGELTADWRAQNPDLISGENSAQALLAKIKAAQLKSNAAASKAKRPKQTSLAL